MKHLKTYRLFEAKKNKAKEEVPTEYFTMEHILDILQDFVDDEKVDIPSDPEGHGDNPRQSNHYWKSLKYLKTIDCLQTYVNGKQYVSWQTFDEVRQMLQKWNVKNCFGNSDKDWRSEYYIYNPIIEKSFVKLVGECKSYPSGDGIATFYVGKGDTCHFIAVNNGKESEYQIGSNKHFLVSTKIWDHFTSVYSMDNKMTQRLLKHLVGRYFNLKMDGNLMWPDKYGYVIDKKDTQKIYRDSMGIDESFHEDDVNARLTSTVSDIFDDLSEDDFDIQCFTVGYKTLLDAGATYSDNDISLFIMKEYYETEVDDEEMPVNKSFTLEEILPYLERAIDFMESEGRPVREISYQYREKTWSSTVKQVDVKTLDELLSEYRKGNPNIESINIDFGTGYFNPKGDVRKNESIINEQLTSNEETEDIYADIDIMGQDLQDIDDKYVVIFGGEYQRYDTIPKYVSISKENYGTTFTDKGGFFKTRIPFNIKEIKEFLYRLIDYLGDKLYAIEYIYGKLNSDIYGCRPYGQQQPHGEEAKKMVDLYISRIEALKGTDEIIDSFMLKSLHVLEVKVKFK